MRNPWCVSQGCVFQRRQFREFLARAGRWRVPSWHRGRRFGLALLAALLPAGSVPAAEPPGAAVFLYQRIGDEDHPEQGLAAELFAEHLAALTRGGFTVLGAGALAEALAAGRPLPPRAVVLTVDGAHAGLAEGAAPLLAARGLPWTLFVSPAAVDRGAGMLDWPAIRALVTQGLELGLGEDPEEPLAALPPEAVAAVLNHALVRLRAETGVEARLFAYAEGAPTPLVTAALAERGFVAAFAKHVGIATADQPRLALPRFAMNAAGGQPERFLQAAEGLALAAAAGPTEGGRPTLILPAGLEPEGLQSGELECFADGLGRVALTPLEDRRLLVDLPLAPARATRLSCLMPGPEGRWRWWGRTLWAEDAPQTSTTLAREGSPSEDDAPEPPAGTPGAPPP